MNRPAYEKGRPVRGGLFHAAPAWFPIVLVGLLHLLGGCGSGAGGGPNEAPPEVIDVAQAHVDSAIAAAGGHRYQATTISFIFRGMRFRVMRGGGRFEMERARVLEGDTVQDIVDNDGHRRLVAGRLVELPDSMAAKYHASVNSVIYFALLPYGLNDPAVRKQYLGVVDMEGRPHHELRITFVEAGGGEGHEDVFMYWFDVLDHGLNYLAYDFKEDGGGSRFRKAVHTRTVGGIRFVDWINMAPTEGDDVPLERIAAAFHAGRLDTLSHIALEAIRVEPLR